MKRIKKFRYLTEKRRSYTSKDSALTEEEFWSHNNRLDESRKDRPNILPAEVYRLDKTWKPDDVIASVSSILGIQLTGPQKGKRESMSLHLRDDPKLVLGVFDFGSLNKAPACPHDNSRLPHEHAVPPKLIAHNSANVIVVFNSAGIEKLQSVLADQDVRGLNMSISDIGPKTFVAVRSDITGRSSTAWRHSMPSWHLLSRKSPARLLIRSSQNGSRNAALCVASMDFGPQMKSCPRT